MVGVPGQSLSFGEFDADCVIEVLPGGGPSKVLSTDYTFGNNCKIQPASPPILKKGKIKNTLLAQTLTLALNLKGNEDLANLEMYDGHLRTAATSDCDYTWATVVGEYSDHMIPSQVIAELMYDPQDLGYTNTVGGILTLANNALGDVGGYNNGMLNHIANAANIINEAFDECRFGYFALPDGQITIPPPANPVKPSGYDLSNFLENTMLKASPNPFTEMTTIQFKVPSMVRVSLEVYTLQGQHIETLFTGMAAEKVVHSYQFHAKTANNQTTFIYLLKTVYGTKMGKMIMIR
jgi:hypothetical protein